MKKNYFGPCLTFYIHWPNLEKNIFAVACLKKKLLGFNILGKNILVGPKNPCPPR